MLDIESRIRESGFSLDEVAERAGFERERLSAIVEGADFDLSELLSLANAIGLAVSDFVAKPSLEDKTVLLFRQPANRKSNVGLKNVADRFARQVANSFYFVPQRFEKLTWLNNFTIDAQTYDVAELNAEKFRAAFYSGDVVSPILSLPRIATDALGIFLFVVPEQHVDGASAITDGQAFIFLAPRFAPRMLFTLAHELGHLVAHHGSDEVAYIDEGHEFGSIRTSSRIDEAFADAFASALLMPAKGVGIALKKIREIFKTMGPLGDIEIIYLARIYGVSFEAAARRCEDLQLIPRGGAVSLYEKINKDYGSPEKRAEQLNVPARPVVDFPTLPSSMIDSVLERINSGELSIGQASTMLRISIADIYSLNADRDQKNNPGQLLPH